MTDESTSDETPLNLETELIRQMMPPLNQPKTGVSSTTGYRDQSDANGLSNVQAAVSFMTSLDKLPVDADDKVDVRLLNEGWDADSGTAAPTENFRRGLLELGTQSFLQNSYPEWIGDSMDDANQDLESLAMMVEIKWRGWEWFNDMLNTKPELDEDGDEVYPEDNILFLDFSAITNELFQLMRGREESARVSAEIQQERLVQYREMQAKAIQWAKDEKGLTLAHDDSDISGYASPFYTTPDELTRYVIWNEPFRIVAKIVRADRGIDWQSDENAIEHYEH